MNIKLILIVLIAFFSLPRAVSQSSDIEKEIKIIEEEITYLEGFLKSVMKKLGNERFVNNAPEKVVALEKKKKEDSEKRIAALKNKLESLKSQ